LLLLLLFQAAGGATPARAQKCHAPATAAAVAQMEFLVGAWQGQVVELGIGRALQVRFYTQGGRVRAHIREEGRLSRLL
jgi:hypothetical protein